MNNDYIDKKLGELLKDKNQVIRRNAISIIKEFNRQKCDNHIPILKGRKIRCVTCNKKLDEI